MPFPSYFQFFSFMSFSILAKEFVFVHEANQRTANQTLSPAEYLASWLKMDAVFQAHPDLPGAV